MHDTKIRKRSLRSADAVSNIRLEVPMSILKSCVFLFLFSWILFPPGDLSHLSRSARSHYLHEARVWRQTDIPGTNILAGPQSPIAIPPEHEVDCQYVEPREVPTGYSPKFQCKLAGSQQVAHVKYGSHEVYAEVAGTRLLWALGFYTDEDYPVKIRCSGCPEKSPFHPSKSEARVERYFDDAIIEQAFEGEIAEYHDQGWTWQELDLVDVRFGGAPKREVDALKLLAVFIQHTDSKRQQQRIGCFPADVVRQGNMESCKKPVLMIQDLGCTFGAGAPEITAASSMNLPAWRSRPIWNYEKEAQFAQSNPGKRACFGNLTSADFAKRDGLFDPQISEDGRKFLADLLNQLSDQQIYNLFQAARADKTEDVIDDHGRPRPINLDDWVAAFKEKRREITEHHCS
jgi:hypothetical protein